MITSELFEFIPMGNFVKTKDGDVIEYKLFMGTQKFAQDKLKFTAHRPHGIPTSITVSRHNGDCSIPKHGMDQLPITEDKEVTAIVYHDNIGVSNYYN